MLEDSILREIGIHQYGVIAPSEIDFSDAIRRICEDNSCRQYGRTWACPPAVGTLEECKARCLKYKHAMVFNGVYELEDSFDYQGMMEAHGEFKKLCDRLYPLVKDECTDFLLLSNEGCNRCKKCTYPKSPCIRPEMLFPSVEGYGINVANLGKSAGVIYNNGEKTVTYFGVLLY